MRSVWQLTFCFVFSFLLLSAGASEESYDVIILGAGAAGLAAARQLHDSGQNNFIILEARDRIGGRIHTVNFDGAQTDLGAQFIVGEEGNEAYKLAKANGALNDANIYLRSVVYDYGGEPVDYSSLVDYSMLEKRLSESSQMRKANGSYWDFVWPKLKESIRDNDEDEDIDMWKNFFKTHMVYHHNADDVNSLGARGVAEYEFPSGYDTHTWKKGFKTLLHILMGKSNGKDPGNGIEAKIQLRKEAVKVEYSETEVKVTCADGSVYKGHKIIVTLPLGVLKSLPDGFWSPPLPEEKRKAIEALGVSSLNKIVIHFDKRWWPANRTSFHPAWRDSKIRKFVSESNHGKWPLSIAAVHTVPRHVKFLHLYVVGEGSKSMEAQTDTEVMSACMDFLKRLFGRRKHFEEGKLLLRSKWNSDPFSKGSQVYRTVKSDDENIRFEHLIEPIKTPSGTPILAFAGDAAHTKYFGTVHGAVESGRAAAENLQK